MTYDEMMALCETIRKHFALSSVRILKQAETAFQTTGLYLKTSEQYWSSFEEGKEIKHPSCYVAIYFNGWCIQVIQSPYDWEKSQEFHKFLQEVR